jgi:addiction module RelE/StbE family toxin
MKIDLHRNFKKKFKKLSPKIKRNYFERVELFLKDSFNPLLDNHSVGYIYPNWRSINITGDYRVLFEPKDDDGVIFMKIGTHSELYK